jgi:hypothetical protein
MGRDENEWTCFLLQVRIMLNDVVLVSFEVPIRKKYLLSERNVIMGQLEINLKKLQEMKHDSFLVRQLTNEKEALYMMLIAVNIRLSAYP